MKHSAFLSTLLLAVAPAISSHAMNPYLPLWEHIPDGEPYIFDDPDNPGKKRVYIYGSHDMLRTEYCGTDQVVWSAPVDDLENWRFDGVIFKVTHNADGKQLHPDGRGDVLYAPDIAERILPDGSKEYFLYPNNQAGGRNGMVAKSNRPDGPFVVINWSQSNPDESDGVLRFDPAVFIDDDGRVYGYWGFEKSYMAELDPKTMATVKPGAEIKEDVVSSYKNPGDFRFFEASSMRKIKDKYIFIYSRWTGDGEYGLPSSNYTLAYAYSDNPLGPFTYGGTIIDARGRDTDAHGNVIFTATPNGNTHGSICEINGQWYVFYHRQSGLDEFSRQAMVEPINIQIEEGPGGKVSIAEAELTSMGFETDGLDPFRPYPAAIASHFTGPEPAKQAYPGVHYPGPYFEVKRQKDHTVAKPYEPSINYNPVINCTDGSILGYKYYNFDKLNNQGPLSLALDIVPQGIDGTIKVYTSAPWKGNPTAVGEFAINSRMDKKPTRVTAELNGLESLSGKQPLYLTFHSPTPGQSIATITHLQFVK